MTLDAVACDPYSRVDVSTWEEVRTETVGVTAKWWLRPDPRDPSTEWLWKAVSVEATGRRRTLGQDWSERVATEVARRLGVPCARVELATRHGVRGVTVQNFAPRPSRLSLSNASVLFPTVVDGYQVDKTGEVPGYTLGAAFVVLDGYDAAPGVPDAVEDGASTFAGYLMFDALIGNGDRHHDNWGVVIGLDGRRYIAPSFDHATGLGFQEVEERKAEYLERGDVETWASRRRSRQFEGKPRLVDLAVEALLKVPHLAARCWVERLEALGHESLAPILARVPDDLMSQVDRTFAVEVQKEGAR